MADERWQRLKSLCQQALECEPGDRDAFLAKACADNPDLLRDAKSLLLQATQGEGILDAPVWQNLAIGPDDETREGVAPIAKGELEGIGRYKNLQRIGRGGMGTVYRALDPAIGRTVAIKVLLVDDPLFRARFQQEVRAAGTLTHQHIVSIYDYGESEGRPYIVMEYVDGRSLADVLRDRFPLTLAHRLRLVQQLCAALDYAHAHGVVHRDIKPANVMLDQHGDLKVVDFGIAKLGEGQLTRTGNVLGTLTYMSPEQIEGGMVDRRSDIFSVGVVMYELVTSRRAFAGDTASTVIRAIIHDQPVAPTELVPNLDPAVDQIVRKALHKDPAERYPTLGQMAADLARVRIAESTVIPAEHAPTVLIGRRTTGNPAAAPVPAVTQSEPVSQPRVPSSRRGLVIAAAFVLIVAIGAGLWLAHLIPIAGGPTGTTATTATSGSTPEVTKQTTSTTAATGTPPATASVVTPAVDDSAKKPAKKIEIEKPQPIETTRKAQPVAHQPTAYEQAQALLSERPTPEQKSTAAGLLQKACDDKEYAACLQAGLLYHDDFALKNLPLAVQLYQRACDGGNAQGCHYLAIEYARGIAVAKDEVKSASLDSQACEGGVPAACTNLGRNYQNGRGVPRDLTQARALFQKACDAGGIVGCSDGGVLLIRGIGGPRDPDHAVAMLQRACDAGNPPGCAALAAAYSRGDGVDQSDGRAAELYQRACDAGGAPACNNLAAIYTSGSGVTKDLARAAALLQRSCDGSFADACQSLSKRYEQGTGVERNAARATELARRATQLRASQSSAQ